jgi:hypothetical protein
MGLKCKEKILGRTKIKFWGDKLIILYILGEILKFLGDIRPPTHQRGSTPIMPRPVTVRALAADFQLFSLYLGNKTTFCFPIKKYSTIDSLTFLYIN